MPLAFEPGAQGNRYEHILQTGGPVGARLAAASLQARQEVAVASAHERAIRDVGAGVAGPLLVAYVLWILHDARARGIKRLYFLSRDGEVLLDLADVLAPRLGITIERRYLYASRRAWYSTRSAWPWDDPDLELTLDDLLAQLSVPRDAVAADLASLGFERFDTILSKKEHVRLRAYFFASDRLEAIAIQTEEQRLLHDYLQQEGLFDGVPKAMVDLGGHGTQHHALCKLLARNGEPLCPLYLFWGEPCDWPWLSLRRCFHFDGARKEAGHQRKLDYVPMEIFCSAEHGTLTGFRRVGDRVEPNLADARTVVLRAWGLSLLRETLAVFARRLDLADVQPAEAGLAGNPALGAMIDRLFDTFWLAPTVEEAQAWSQFPWDLGEGEEMAICAPYTLMDLPTSWRQRTLRKRVVFWVDGALALTPSPVVTILLGGHRVLHTVRKVRHKGGVIVRTIGRALGRLGGTSGTPSR